jgi:putative PIN family toxin of toxin-antitoxin system
MLPLRLVLDTNIMVSALIKPDGLQKIVLTIALTQPARLSVSPDILEEYRMVLDRPKFAIRKGRGGSFFNFLGHGPGG